MHARKFKSPNTAHIQVRALGQICAKTSGAYSLHSTIVFVSKSDGEIVYDFATFVVAVSCEHTALRSNACVYIHLPRGRRRKSFT